MNNFTYGVPGDYIIHNATLLTYFGLGRASWGMEVQFTLQVCKPGVRLHIVSLFPTILDAKNTKHAVAKLPTL